MNCSQGHVKTRKQYSSLDSEKKRDIAGRGELKSQLRSLHYPTLPTYTSEKVMQMREHHCVWFKMKMSHSR